MIAALVIGTALAVGALAFVLYPVFFGVKRRAHSFPRRASTPSATRPSSALREIEFDRATGKLSDADYAELKTRYTKDAITAMRREKSPGDGTPADDEIEAAVRDYRDSHATCPTCGPRPEPMPSSARTAGGTYTTGAPVAAHLSTRMTRGTA